MATKVLMATKVPMVTKVPTVPMATKWSLAVLASYEIWACFLYFSMVTWTRKSAMSLCVSSDLVLPVSLLPPIYWLAVLMSNKSPWSSIMICQPIEKITFTGNSLSCILFWFYPKKLWEWLLFFFIRFWKRKDFWPICIHFFFHGLCGSDQTQIFHKNSSLNCTTINCSKLILRLI